jgi:hypothetical protein
MFIQKSALLLRDVYVTFKALDEQLDAPIRVLLHNMSVDRNHDLTGVMYGRYEITVSEGVDDCDNISCYRLTRRIIVMAVCRQTDSYKSTVPHLLD